MDDNALFIYASIDMDGLINYKARDCIISRCYRELIRSIRS